jgi:hypothetical protein
LLAAVTAPDAAAARLLLLLLAKLLAAAAAALALAAAAVEAASMPLPSLVLYNFGAPCLWRRNTVGWVTPGDPPSLLLLLLLLSLLLSVLAARTDHALVATSPDATALKAMRGALQKGETAVRAAMLRRDTRRYLKVKAGAWQLYIYA